MQVNSLSHLFAARNVEFGADAPRNTPALIELDLGELSQVVGGTGPAGTWTDAEAPVQPGPAGTW